MSKHFFYPALFVITFFCCLIQTIHAQTPVERHARIRAAVEAGDNLSAIREIQTLGKESPALIPLNNYDYLLARLSERRGDEATAASYYQIVSASQSALTEYALWHLSEFARSAGNLVFEREQLRELIDLFPSSQLREAARARLAESFYESGDYASAIYYLQSLADAKANSSSREALALLGQAYLRSGQKEKAHEVFNSLIAQQPDQSHPDDFALAAARGLDALDSGSPEAAQKAAPQLSESEHLRRAFIYNFNRDFASARLHYTAILDSNTQSPNAPDALFQIGRGLYQERRFDEATDYFQRAFKQFPSSSNARDALGYYASTLNRLKRTDEAVAAYRQFIERYPQAPQPERSYLNIIDALHEAARYQEALDWVNKTRARFKGQPAALALFAEARVHLAQEAWTAALVDFEALSKESDLGGTRTAGGTTPNEVAFLRAFTLEKLNRTDEAVSAYLSLADGRDQYYGRRATERLQALAADANSREIVSTRLYALRAQAQNSLASNQTEAARKAAQSALRLAADEGTRRELLEIARRAYATLPSYNNLPAPRLLPFGRQEVITSSRDNTSRNRLSDELLFLGLYDEGAPEFAASAKATESSAQVENNSANADEKNAAKNSQTKPQSSRQATTPSRDLGYTLAVIYKRGDHADHAVHFAEPIWKNVPADYLIELAPREMVELLYPVPYRAAIIEYAPPRGVDPRFLLSIARQETRFQPDAKSAAAARGLVQFIPSTSNEIASQLHFLNFAQDDLYNPRVSILFGAQYMGNLFQLFPQQPQAVVASYNGGEDNVARWIARARSNDADRYVPEIGFAQSKDYVFKVMANYWAYQSLYDEQLKPR